MCYLWWTHDERFKFLNGFFENVLSENLFRFFVIPEGYYDA